LNFLASFGKGGEGFEGLRGGQGLQGFAPCGAIQSKHTCVSGKFTACESKSDGGSNFVSLSQRQRICAAENRKRDRRAADMGNYSPFAAVPAGNVAIHGLGIAFIRSLSTPHIAVAHLATFPPANFPATWT